MNRDDASFHSQATAGASNEGNLGKLVMDLSPIGIPCSAGGFALRVEGDAMIGADIREGDILLFDERDSMPGEIIAAYGLGKIMIRRMVVSGGASFLHPENPNFADIHLSVSVRVVGVAVGLIRRL